MEIARPNGLIREAVVFRAWAEANQFVTRIWFFGSRVRGDHRPDSDLDVAVEHQAGPGDASVLATAIAGPEEWLSELQPQVEVRLDLQSYLGDDTPTIREALRVSSVLVFERTAA